MISAIGNVTLYIVLLVNLVSFATVFFLFKDESKERFVKFYTDLTFILLSFALVVLLYAFATSDFTLKIVLNNSHQAHPTIYKLCSVWGNHEGSMLLWLWLFSFFNLLFLYCSNFSKIDKAKILTVQSAIMFGLLLFVIFTSNPFLKTTELFPVGKGLNPLLQDFGMLIHPPTLFLGFVNFSLGYSAAIIALIKGEIDNHWFLDLKSWIMFPWVCMTAGIGLGSWWAYRELGWGGFWFWDPVENASLLPWLAATALIHSVKLATIRGCLKLWALGLSILTFLLTIFSTFLVRSGIVTSLHGFAYDNQKGIFILALLTVFSLAAIIVFLLRYSKIKSTQLIQFFGKDGGIILNCIMLLFLILVILAGILYPVGYEYITSKIVTLESSYYENMIKIIVLPLVISAAIFTFLRWGNDSIASYLFPWGWLLIASILLTVATHLYQALTSYFAIAVLIFSYFLSLNLLVYFVKNIVVATSYFSSAISMFISHFGLALIVIAITLNMSWQQEVTLTMKEGTSMSFSNYILKLKKIEYLKQDNFFTRKAEFNLIRDNNELGLLYPETRYYPVENKFTTESAIFHSLGCDIYLTISEMLPGKKIIVTMQYKPLMNLLWLGIFLVSCGGAISLFRKRLRP